MSPRSDASPWPHPYARQKYPELVRLQRFCREDLDFYLLSEGKSYAFSRELDRLFRELDELNDWRRRPTGPDPSVNHQVIW